MLLDVGVPIVRQHNYDSNVHDINKRTINRFILERGNNYSQSGRSFNAISRTIL